MAFKIRNRFWNIRKSTPKRADIYPVGHRAVYHELGDSSKEIRLCKVSQVGDVGVEGSRIEVEFETMPLADCEGCYRALSYVWGDPNDCLTITVKGVTRPVTRNLHYWLLRIYALGYGSRIWIDALSIDQTNDQEKEQQVALMRSIYEGAKEVLVGIGEHVRQEDADKARAALEDMSTGIHLRDLASFVRLPTDSSGEASVNNHPFLDLVNTPWFKRTWTVQEFCLAKKSILICPWGDMRWSMFVAAFGHYNRHRRECCTAVAEKQPELADACDRVYCHTKSLEHTKKSLENDQHILEAVQLFMHLSVTDLRDKVYGLLALHRGSGSLPIPVYGNKSTASVYADFTMWNIHDSKSLFPLAFELNSEGSEVPSWAMDLSLQPAIDINYWRRRLAHIRAHRASAGIPFVADQVSPGSLCVQGIAVGRVDAVTEGSLCLPDCNFDHIGLLREWYDFSRDRRADSLVPDLPDTTIAEHPVFDDSFCTAMLGIQIDTNGAKEEVQKADLDEWRMTLAQMLSDPSGSPVTTGLLKSHFTSMLGRKMFQTDSGFVGVGPALTKVGDVLWILGGGSTPFVLRPTSALQQAAPIIPSYTVVGPSEVDGMMNGELCKVSAIQQCVLV